MGLLFSRFRGKKTTIEILEGIDKEINRLQRSRKENQDRQKKFVTSLVIYSVAAYVISALIFFCLYFPDTWPLRCLYSVPLLVFPFLVWGLKKLLHWYFVKRIASNDVALLELRDRKKQILEDVMETETYKKAREILEKFDPTRLRKLEGTSDAPAGSINIAGTPGTVVHQRTVRTTQQVRGTPTMTPRMPTPRLSSPRMPTTPVARPRQPVTPYPSTPRPQAGATTQPTRMVTPSQNVVRMPAGYVPPPGPPMPRTVLPRDRGTMDRLMDYLVGDGPENRYALICRQCHSHNGMALKEEFEYLSFRCCYCFFMNPARKQRPLAPRLEFFAPPGSSGRRPQSASGASNNDSDDDDDDDGDNDSSERESSKSDTTAGVPTIESVAPPPVIPGSTSEHPPQKQRSEQEIKIGQSLKSMGSVSKSTKIPTKSDGSTAQPGGGILAKSSASPSIPGGSQTKLPVSQTRPTPSQSTSNEDETTVGESKDCSQSTLVSRKTMPSSEENATSFDTVTDYKLIKSAEGIRTIPEFDKNDFFSVPAGNVAPRMADGAAQCRGPKDLLNFNNNALGEERGSEAKGSSDENSGVDKGASGTSEKVDAVGDKSSQNLEGINGTDSSNVTNPASNAPVDNGKSKDTTP